MLPKTDLEGVKNMAKMLLQLPVEADNPFGIVSHPFINTLYFPKSLKINGEDSLIPTNILEDKELYDKVMKDFEDRIDRVKKYSEFLIIVNKPYLPVFFKFTKEYLNFMDYTEFLRELWTYVEFPNNDKNVSKREFVSYFKKASKNLLMTDHEVQVFQELPQEITIYRGTGKHKNYKALSWTLDLDKAKWFANRWNQKGTVYKAKIKYKDCLAYFEGRGESELVVDYSKLYDIKEMN